MMIVSVVVMLAVPVSQLQLASIEIECCCPDPDQCKCPDHNEQGPSQTTIQACHKKRGALASAAASTLAMPDIAAIDVPAPHVATVEFSTSEPHDPPSPDRPPGPS